MTPVLDIRDVRKSFGAVEALRGAELLCPAGEVTALVGDNGAGKSTLIRCITGVHAPDSGSISFRGEAVAFSSPTDARARGIETVYQDLALIEDLAVWQNMYLNRELTRGFGPFRWLERRRMIDETQTRLGRLLVNMPPVRAKVRRLSGGQRQSIAIGRAASWGSSLVIMDEPTAALGLRERGAVETLIGNLRGEGIAQLIISHDLEQVMRISDSIWVMRGGRTIANWRTKDVDRTRIVAAIAGGTV
ncbi:ATP-binding cassette domain-containing protein [Acidocella aminolytica]|jgi:D-xylose transport system ATP-binding protein|uniref:ABC transporter sugar permease n=1 Tax=Acidocella aminolytica 101 = DSM 11237 TaxID=1120923 RepID=A0A0D6PF07_9PROT|nr:ATP-binding cassette domain-containing protein [Acidocella aminolytica]GAN79444.1 ABC transporter sugar permease [Acidocella aminolytica 101 = DSM 11237]GBQ43967.1 sugar ABC transporter ATP-binding protein [Acidocella aminolytica 101 = DSM 11237]SHE46035.1 D-xylose transport system ATP-binding protein [Acidocella aminolytica 101 = DSM 11237]